MTAHQQRIARSPGEPRPEGPAQRRRIRPPALAPELAATTRLSAVPLLPAFVAVAGLAVISFLSGGSPLAVGLLGTLGAGALALQAHGLQRGHMLAAQAGDEALRSREEIERLADRMWELQESDERARGLTDALGDIVVHRDREGRIVYANRVLSDLLGRGADDLVGRRLLDLGIDIGLVPDSAFSEGECLSSTDVAIRTREGERWFSWIELSVRDKENDAVSHRAIAREITARKRAETALISARERAEAANEAKSRFLATVSHEIRTPMNGIMGMAHLLGDTELTPEQRTYVAAVSTSAAALLALIDDLLDYSKIEFGRFDLEPQPVSPQELAENVVELIAPRAHGRGIGLGCHVAPDVPALIEADPGRLRQVLINIVGNAVKFTETGGILVEVGMAGEGAGRRIRFSVSDTGPGIDSRDIARLFEEFEQGDGTSTRKHGGTGLGLAISRRIVVAMGGVILAESEPGKGSRFTIEIPAAGAVAARLDLAGALCGRRAVVVSANAMEARAIALTIAAHGGRADIIGTAEEADALDDAHAVDTVLVDATLEHSDGRVLRRLHKAGLDRAEAVTLIAPGERGRLTECRAVGYGSFLVRPVRGATLLRVLLSSPGAAPAAHAAAGPAEQAAPKAGADGLSVLVAEDNDINALLARSALTKAGHRIDIVPNGKAAVEALTSAGGAHRYDVVLMDLHMPVMDGLEAIALIRRHEEANGMPAVPILVLSADSQEKTRHGVIAHGATGFLTKPVDPRAMIEAVEGHATA